jgi:hypothetical protein
VDTVLVLITMVLSLALLWAGRKKLRFGSLVSTTLSVIELLALGILVVSLGWWGLIALAAVNAIAFAVYGIILAARVEERLVYASIQTDEPREAVEALAARLGKRPELANVGPVERAELIKLLSERARSVAEIEDMAVPIALLQVVHRPPWPWLVGHFDQLLRLAGEPASEAMRMADVLSSATKHSAATFEEIVEAMVAAYTGGSEPSSARGAA